MSYSDAMCHCCVHLQQRQVNTLLFVNYICWGTDPAGIHFCSNSAEGPPTWGQVGVGVGELTRTGYSFCIYVRLTSTAFTGFSKESTTQEDLEISALDNDL